MKKFRQIRIVMLGVMVFAFTTSCEDYLDVNKDPNNPTDAPANLILPAAQTYTASYLHEDRRLSHLGNMLMYNWSEAFGFSWYNDEFQYLVTTTFYNGLFDYAYENPLKQYHLLTSLEGEENTHYVAIGKIMKAYHFQILVDLYGSVPYFEALQRSGNATPKYDAGEDIYADLLIQLNEAIELINSSITNTTVLNPGEQDVMFGGNMVDWIRFANTLKLRILTRWSDTAPGSAIQAEVDLVLANPYGTIVSDVIVNPGYLQEEGKQNPFWDDFGAGVDGTTTLTHRATPATQYMIDLLEATNDPRLDYWFEQPENGHLGVDQIAEPGAEYGFENVSNIGPGLLVDPTMGSNIFTSAENYFNAAELAFKGFINYDPESLYNMGIYASFQYLGAPGYEAYREQPSVNYSSSLNKLASIMFQKRLAVMGITAEQSWFDYTRTGYPVTPIAAEASTPDRPVRLFFPASELSTNAANVPSQPNAFTAKPFWAN